MNTSDRNRAPEALADALALIDRRYGSSPYRAILRAAACFNYDGAPAWHAEMCRGLDEVADALGIPRSEVDRLVMPPSMALTRRLPPMN